jgi:hypothetical protein
MHPTDKMFQQTIEIRFSAWHVTSDPYIQAVSTPMTASIFVTILWVYLADRRVTELLTVNPLQMDHIACIKDPKPELILSSYNHSNINEI